MSRRPGLTPGDQQRERRQDGRATGHRATSRACQVMMVIMRKYRCRPGRCVHHGPGLFSCLHVHVLRGLMYGGARQRRCPDRTAHSGHHRHGDEDRQQQPMERLTPHAISWATHWSVCAVEVLLFSSPTSLSHCLEIAVKAQPAYQAVHRSSADLAEIVLPGQRHTARSRPRSRLRVTVLYRHHRLNRPVPYVGRHFIIDAGIGADFDLYQPP